MTLNSPIWELCPECGYKTPHDVHIESRLENETSVNAKFSREPYRVSECLECGAETELRMNNA